MHFDAALVGVEKAMVLPRAHVEIGTDQTVHVAQHVQVEGGRDAQRIVIGGVEDGVILDQVDADQQAAIAVRIRAQAAQKGDRLLGRKIADRRARIEEQAPRVAHAVGQVQAAGEIQAQARHLDVRKALLQPAQRFAEEIVGNIHGHVLGRVQQREQAGSLGAIARAQVDQGAARPHGVRDLGAVASEDGRFRARRIVLGQGADGFEQFRTERVVQVFGRGPGIARQQAAADLGYRGRSGAGRFCVAGGIQIGLLLRKWHGHGLASSMLGSRRACTVSQRARRPCHSGLQAPCR
ncbi:hypothetical protein D3C72_1440510 [compost metagenome]